MIETTSIPGLVAELASSTDDGISFECILGAAGTGKSTLLRERAQDDPNYAKVCATTGIAAVNLGPGITTVNSALGFFNEETAFEALEHGRLAGRFVDLAEQGYKNLVIDEVSMMSAGTLTAISLGCKQGADTVHRMNSKRTEPIHPTNLILTGDFCQLPPVNAPFAFTGPIWPRYDANIVKLDKVYRQTNPAFLEALQAARAGRGTTAVQKLSACGVEFVSDRNDFFDGTSLVPTNDMANKINAVRYAEIAGTERNYKSARWGKESGEWKDIPEQLGMKVGALVMVLANEPVTFEYVNGDTGVVLDMGEAALTVEIRRGDRRHVKEIPYVWRETVQKDEPEVAAKYDGVTIDGQVFRMPNEIERAYKQLVAEYRESLDSKSQGVAIESANRQRAKRFAMFFEFYDGYVADAIKRRLPYFSVDKGKWVVGWIEYMPLRLAYASTIHKCVAANTIVYEQERGPIKIKDLRAGSKIWDRSRWVAVKEIHRRLKPAMRITTRSGYEIVCSPDHRFPLYMSDDKTVLTPASELQPKSDRLLLAPWKLPNSGHKMAKCRAVDLAYLAGIMVGDGSYTDRKEGNVHFCCSDPQMRDFFTSIVKHRFGIHANDRSDGKGSFFTSMPVRKMLANCGLDYVKGPDKTIPWGLVKSAEAAAAFLQGLMDTDGSVGRSHVIYCTASLELSKQVQMLFAALEIKSVRETFQGLKRPYYQIRIGAHQLPVYKDVVGFRRKRKAEKLAACNPNRIILWQRDHEEISSIEDLGVDVEMVDIEVNSPSHCFSANGLLTHNSQGLTLDRLQIDARSRFAGNPGMIYVALSRCRTPENIRVVCSVSDFARRIQTAKECMRWV